MNEIVRCKKCILPETYPGITFDECGICNYCLEPEEPPARKKEELDEYIDKFRGESKKYDAVVGLSGGKDSTYVAYYLHEKYDLKLMGFNYDIGYTSEIAIENIKKITEKLDIPLISIRPRKKFIKKLFAHFLKTKGEFCSVCNNLGYLIGGSFAFNQKLSLGFSPLMVGGWSRRYEYQPGVSVTNMSYFFDNLNQELLDELKAQPFIEEKIVTAFKRLIDPRQAQMGTKAHNQLGENAMSFIMLPDFIDWNPRKIPEILSEELDWKHPEDVHESHFDCKLFPIKEYLKVKKYGLTQETIKNSRLIREERMTREEALERMSREQTTEPEIFDEFLQDLGLTKKCVNWKAEWST